MTGRNRIWLYFGVLTVTCGLGDPTGLINLPVLFLLKDGFNSGPQSVALFEVVISIPHYGSFLFGLLRDRWSPMGLGDRGYFLFAAPIAAACYLWLAIVPVSYGRLIGFILVAMFAFQLLYASSQALMTTVAQQQLMTGRLTALWEISENSVNIVATLAGGWIASHYSTRPAFVIAAGLSVAMFVQGFWKPREVFSHPDNRTTNPESGRTAISRFIRHRPLWPTTAILLLFNFSPGWGTPWLYYLTNNVGISPEVFGICRAVQYAAAILTSIAYGVLCRRYTLKHLLWWAIPLNIFPGFLFLLIAGAPQAVAVSAGVGALNAFATITLFDLLLRSCPKGFEGSGTMLGISAFGIAGAAGDVLGSWLYVQGGFALSLALDAAATVLILPLLRFLSDDLIATREDQTETSVQCA